MGQINNSFNPLLDNLLEAIMELVTDPAGKPMTARSAAVEKVPELETEISFTEQEINRLEEVIDIQDGADSELEEKARTEEIKEELKEELKSELKSELDSEQPKSTTKDPGGETLRQELITYSANYVPVQIIIQSGDRLQGVVCEVEADFIALINAHNQFIKIPLTKIVAVKKIEDLADQSQTDLEIESESIPAPEELFDRELVKVENSSEKN